MAKQNWRSALVKNLKANGWIEVNGLILPQNKLTEEQSNALTMSSAKNKQNRSKGLKTGWVDDSRNLKNKAKQTDPFILLVKQELGLDVWPEFYFSTERQFRLDYAIPILRDGNVIKLGLEIDGGIWCRGNSGHSSGRGIKRDQEKASLLASLGWLLIRIEPSELMTNKTLSLIEKSIKNGK